METSKKTYRVGDYYLTRNRQGFYCRTWYDERTQQRKSTSLRTKIFAEAKERLDEWFMLNTTPTLQKDVTLAMCIMQYHKQHARYLARAASEARNGVYWLEFFPEKMVSEIRPIQQRLFLQDLKKRGYSKGYIESIFKTGTAAMTWAWKNDMILDPLPLLSPTKELARFKMQKVERWRALEPEEIAKMLHYSNNERLTRFIKIMIGCACRSSAAVELSGKQIDLKAGTIDLLAPGEVQTTKYRPTVKLPSFIREIYTTNNLVSQTRTTPNINNLRNRYWNKTRESAGLDKLVVPYSIRHTMARWLRKSGVQPWHASSQLGHTGEGGSITEIYAADDPQYLDDALAAIEEFYRVVNEIKF